MAHRQRPSPCRPSRRHGRAVETIGGAELIALEDGMTESVISALSSAGTIPALAPDAVGASSTAEASQMSA